MVASASKKSSSRTTNAADSMHGKKNDARGQPKSKARSAEHSSVMAHGPRPLWTGVIAFGLVSLPVALYSATRSKGSTLKMVDASGVPVSRRYHCEKEGVELSADDIVRGYEVDENKFVIIEDDELRALAPEKSSEINLQKFVSIDEIHPVFFDKSYFLVPDAAALRAYRLLAESMETERRAGIATFVMRDKEYLVAIVAEAGILSAQTLRFSDEIRSPAEVGLPTRREGPKGLVEQMVDFIEDQSASDLERSELEDRQTQRLLERVAEKLEKGVDVIRERSRPKKRVVDASDHNESDVEAVDKVIDLMKVLKSRIEGGADDRRGTTSSRPQVSSSPSPKAALAKRDSKRTATATRAEKYGRSASKGDAEDLETLSRDELYERAKATNIEGRSRMNKQQLIEALTVRP